jgi:hypothetical protein
MDKAYSLYGRDEKCIQNFSQKTEGKRPLRRPRHRWQGTIKMFLKETGCEGMELIHLTQDRDKWQALVNTVMNLQVP